MKDQHLCAPHRAAFAWLALAALVCALSIALAMPGRALADERPASPVQVDLTGSTVQPGAAPASSLASPILKTPRSKGCALVIGWKKARERVDGYQVAISPSKRMKNPTRKMVKGRSKTKLIAKGFPRGKAYYVAVRTYKTGGGKTFSPWSKTKKVRLAKLGRKDLEAIVTDASAKNGTRQRLAVYNSTYKLAEHKAGKRLLSCVGSLARYHKVGIVMCDLTSGETITFAPERSLYSASCLKGPFVASLNKWKPTSRSGSSSSMYATIVWSNNATYAGLRSRYGSSSMLKMHKYAGIGSAGYSSYYRFLPSRDLAKLWIGSYWYFYRDINANSQWARSLYTHGTNSFIYQAMRGTWKVHAKPGWISSGGGYVAQNDAGVVMAKVDGKSRPYVLSVMTSAFGSYGTLRSLVRCFDDVHADMVRAGYELK